MKRLRNPLTLIAVLMSLLFALPAQAKIGFRNLDNEARARRFCVPMAPVPTTAVTTNGLNGVVGATTINSVAAPSLTTTLVNPPHPARLTVSLVDASANDTLTCASVVIIGTNQFGKAVRETLTSLTETAQTTVNVFETVSSVTGATCAGAQDAGDLLHVMMSAFWGLTVPIASWSDVERACIIDDSSTDNTLCAVSNDGTSADIQSAVSVSKTNPYIDLSLTMFGNPASKTARADDDTVCLTIRSSL